MYLTVFSNGLEQDHRFLKNKKIKKTLKNARKFKAANGLMVLVFEKFKTKIIIRKFLKEDESTLLLPS